MDQPDGDDFTTKDKPITTVTTTSLDDKIKNLQEERRTFTDASNQEEFIETVVSDNQTSRLSTKQLNREEHMPAIVADNQEGPLSRYIITTTSGKLVSPHGNPGLHYSSDRQMFDPLEERVRNIETHCGIVVAPIDKSLAERIKILEDKILKIEQMYPQIAAHVFNYGKAEVEASSRPGGRVSKIPGMTVKNQNKRRLDEDSGSDIIYDNVQEDDSSSLGELKRRMDHLKARLLSQSKR